MAKSGACPLPAIHSAVPSGGVCIGLVSMDEQSHRDPVLYEEGDGLECRGPGAAGMEWSQSAWLFCSPSSPDSCAGGKQEIVLLLPLNVEGGKSRGGERERNKGKGRKPEGGLLCPFFLPP